MPDVARFFNIDPLAAKYPHNSTYAFSENRVIDARELEGLEAFVIHGTTQQKTGPSFSKEALNELQKIGGNSVMNTSFRWNSPLSNDRGMRSDAARLLVTHVLSTREKMIKDGTITEKEPVTLIGYSHGGNVSIQSIDRISKQLGIKINLVTVSTPVYSNNSEDPTNKTSINEHTQIVHQNDAVTSFYAGGEDTYPSPDTHKVTNRVISNEEIKLDGGIEAHTDLPIDKKLPEVLRTVPRINNNQQR